MFFKVSEIAPDPSLYSTRHAVVFPLQLIVTFFLVVSRIIFLNSFSLIVEKKDGSNQAAIESCLVQ